MNRWIIIALAAGVVLAAVASYRLAGEQAGMKPVSATSEEARPLYYRHPMNPEVTSPVPARDDMGMDYIPVYANGIAGDTDAPAGTVTIDPVTVQNIGVRTAEAERRSLSRAVRAAGRVGFDEERLRRVHLKTEGWVEELRAAKTGAPVKRDEILLSIYSPQLVTAQEEYLLALENRDALNKAPAPDIRTGAETLLSSARERLELLDVPEHQIRALERTGKVKKDLHLHSPFDGIVTHVGVRAGQYVTPRTELYTIADLSRVWVSVDVYEFELPWIAEGDEAELRLAGIPGRIFRGSVDYIYPYAEPDTRTVKVRLVFDNPGLLLKPEMFAEATIHAQRQIDAVVIPQQAVVRSGTREQVFVVRGPGKFEPREVRLGVSADGYVQVLDGVAPGEQVVTSAQFLIDSESKLREATAKMMEMRREVHD